MPVERAAGGTSLIDVLDRVLDKGIVIDAWVRVSLVGIDLITVEARIVVASIDTYLKYSEAVGQVAPVSKPAIEGKGYEELIAENAALRAQLNAIPARRTAGRRRAAGPRLSGDGPDRTRASRASASQVEEGPRRRRRAARGARCGCSKGFVSRTEIADCAHLALQWLGEVLGIAQSICLVRPADETSLFVVGTYGLSGSAVSRFSVSLDDWGNPLVTALANRKAAVLSRAALRRRSQAAADHAVRGRARFTSLPLGVSGLLRGRLRAAAGRRQRARCRPSCTGSPASSARSSIRFSASRR